MNGNTAAPTPNIKKMMDAGMRLDRHYVFRYVSHSLQEAASSQHAATVPSTSVPRRADRRRVATGFCVDVPFS
eukprot:COSAG06_NODE_1845_length_8230_cov_12.038499_2_plen_73_part_00